MTRHTIEAELADLREELTYSSPEGRPALMDLIASAERKLGIYTPARFTAAAPVPAARTTRPVANIDPNDYADEQDYCDALRGK